MGLLFWAVQTPKIRFGSIDEVFETLSGQRHYQRLPQILQTLQSKDTEFLRERGHSELVHRLNAERKGIALRFLTLLQEEYRTLWEASRMLAAMAPDVVAVEEWERLRLSTIFTWNCFLLQLRLRVGFAPWANFTRISEMASQISYRLEQATSQISEGVLSASELSPALDERRGQSR